MKKIFLAVVTLVMLYNPSFASDGKPKVIVNVIVDALRNDDLIRYTKNFSTSGFRKMMDKGSVIENAQYRDIPNKPMVSGATIITGSWPRQHGIVGDFWYLNGADKLTGAITIAKDTAYTVPLYSIIDKIKYFSPQSKVVSIGVEPKSAIICGDSNNDRVIWLDDLSGKWITSKGKDVSPWWLTTLNEGKTKGRYINTLMMPSFPKVDYINKQSTTLFSQVKHSKSENTGRALLESPFCNSYLNDCLSSLLVFDTIGKDTICDFLTINYGYARFAYKKYGSKSMEVEDMYYKLDNDISRLISMLDTEVGKGEYILIFTAASGASESVEGVVNETRIRVLTNAFLNTQYGIADWVVGYRNGQIYLNHKTIYNKKIGLDVIQDAVASFVLKFDGVENAMTASALMRNSFTTGVEEDIYNSFNAPASGDVMVVLKPNWISLPNGDTTKDKASFENPYQTTISVPLFIYGKGIKAGKVYDEFNMTDIAPTIADILGISRPEKSVGKSFYNNIRYDN
ncbi:MAG: alkaline phosphatase family protein [Rikenellaceae bacterium]